MRLAKGEIMVLTDARLRERFGVPGIPRQVRGFRDKKLMRTSRGPAGRACQSREGDDATRHARARRWLSARDQASRVAGKRRYVTRVGSATEIEAALARMHHVGRRPASTRHRR